MEMPMAPPEHDAHTLQVAFSHSRRVRLSSPSPYSEINSVRDAHLQAAESDNQNDQCPLSTFHAFGTSRLGYVGTPYERTFQEIARHNFPDLVLSAPQLPLDIPHVKGQRAIGSNMHHEMPEADSRVRCDQGNLNLVPLSHDREHLQTQLSLRKRCPESQLNPCRRITARHHPFGAALSCCFVSRSAITHEATQGITNDILPMTNIAMQARCNRIIGTANDDVEKGPPKFERVLLLINRLKCGCCEGGLSRTLERIVAIRNYSVNTILSRIEFDLDVNRLGVDHIIKLLNAKTGYHLEEHISSDGQVLELIITDPLCLKHAGQPKGILRVEAPEIECSWLLNSLTRRGKAVLIDSATATMDGFAGDDGTTEDGGKDPKHGVCNIRIPPTRIYYDPTKIGARDVFEHYLKYDPDLRLAPPTVDPGIEIGGNQSRRALLWFLPTLAFTIPVLTFSWLPIDDPRSTYLHASLALATLVQIVAFIEFVPNAFRSLYYSHILEMDFLIALSTTMAYGFTVVSYVLEVRGTPFETESYFETSTLLVTLILLGRVASEFSRFQAAKSVSFRSLQVKETLLVLPSPNDTWASVKTTRIDSRLLQYGDVFIVPPYTRIVTDGVVLYGGSNVDESMLTGEFKPKAKGLSSQVFAGTNNQDGSLVVKLRKLPCENSVNQIATMIENVGLGKPAIQVLADRIAGWFVFVIAITGAAVFVSWLLVERFHHRHTWKMAFLTAATYAIATSVVSCPCAVGLAIPMVVLIANGVAARYGIIIRDPQMLEIARQVTDVVFDKTGSLTCGRLEVVGVPRYYSTDRARIKGLIMALLKDIKHPVATGIVHYLAQDWFLNKEHAASEVSNIVSVPGKGVQGTCAKTGVVVRAGNADWLKVDVVGRETNTRCYFTIAGNLQASFELKDNFRPGAAMVVDMLHGRRVRVHIISGDTEGAVDDAAGALHIHKDCTKSRCSPNGKRAYISDLQDQGKIVMFVGDGTNNSVALKQANVGVHVGEGSDMAKSAADVVLMTTRLHGILILLDISRAAYGRMITNFSWSGLYNIFAILLAAGAFVAAGSQIRIELQWAGLGELIGVIPVVLIAFLMQWHDYGKAYQLIKNDYQKVESTRRECVV